MQETKVNNLLEYAQALISDGFTKGAFARKKNGKSTPSSSPMLASSV